MQSITRNPNKEDELHKHSEHRGCYCRSRGTELGSSATHYEDAWACMDLTATAQSTLAAHGKDGRMAPHEMLPIHALQGSSRLPVSSDFFDRYIENYVSYPFLPCSTGVPLIVRSGLCIARASKLEEFADYVVGIDCLNTCRCLEIRLGNGQRCPPILESCMKQEKFVTPSSWRATGRTSARQNVYNRHSTCFIPG